MSIEQFDVGETALGQKRSFELSVEAGPALGWPVTLPVLQITGTEPGATLLILAAVHGDEYEGVETILRLYHTLEPELLNGKLLLLPNTNPLAFQGGTRLTPEDGLNMARVFPGDAGGSPTERLAYQLHHRFIAKADFLLDLHSGGSHYAVASLVGYYHEENSELGRRSRAAAEAFGMDLLWAHPTVAPGRTISSAQALGIPWLYTEAYGGKRVRPQDADEFYAGAIRLMEHLDMLKPGTNVACLPASAALPAKIRTIYSDGNFDAAASSESDGFFVPTVKLKASVRKGDPIGIIYGMNGSVLQEVLAYQDGVLVMIAGTPIVKKGEPLYLLADE